MEIIEGNKLIAEFMGAKWAFQSEIYNSYGWKFDEQRPTKHHSLWADSYGLLYHEDWNWLMPVVEKIRDFKIKQDGELTLMSQIHVYINSYGYEWACSILGSITFISHNEKGQYDYRKINLPRFSKKGDKLNSPPIEPTWQAVVAFIQWYNQQTKQ